MRKPRKGTTTEPAPAARMAPYCAWQIVDAAGNPWYEPQRTRGEAITEYVTRAMLPTSLTPAAAWAGEKRRSGLRCARVLVKEWGVADA